MTFPKLPKSMLNDEEQMRVFYRTMGLGAGRIEPAIKAVRDRLIRSAELQTDRRRRRPPKLRAT